MQRKYHVNAIAAGEWPRCQEVRLVEGQLQCHLAFERTYKLLEAYRSGLHLRFLECDSDQQLVSFLKSWGPLYAEWLTLWETRDSVSIPLSRCRAEQRGLRALIGLLTAFKRSAGERAALQEYIEAEYELQFNSLAPSYDPSAVWLLKSTFRIEASVSEWAQSSNLPMVRSATMVALQNVPFMVGASLTCNRKAGRPQVEARWNVDTLEAALRWMVWQDEAIGRPTLCCEECRKVFRADSAHVRKYCSYECGHRVAARKWQKAKRERDKE